MTTHEGARLLLTELALGHLDDDETRAVTAHVDRCEDCRSILAFVEVLREALADETDLVDHPSAMDLARLAVDDASFALDARARVGAHVKTCTVCRDALEAVHEATAERDPENWWTNFRRRFRGTDAAVAGLIVGAGLVGALWATIPTAGGPREAPDDATTPSLVVSTVTLPRVTRSADEIPVLSLAPEARYAVVEIPIDPWNARATADDFPVEVHVSAPGHEWSGRTTATAIFDTDRVRLLVPRAALVDGDVTLTLRAVDGRGSTLHRAVFSVRPSAR